MRQHACGLACALQDLAVVELVRRVAPNLAIHGSTQMSITSADGAEFARLAGAARVVVGRELSIDEIVQVRPWSLAGWCTARRKVALRRHAAMPPEEVALLGAMPPCGQERTRQPCHRE